MESRPEVISASDQHREDVVSIMTLGFADDPVCRQLYPDPAQYLTFFPEFVRLYGGAAFDHEGAHLIQGFGAALWFPPGAHPDGAAINDLIGRSVADSAKSELSLTLCSGVTIGRERGVAVQSELTSCLLVAGERIVV